MLLHKKGGASRDDTKNGCLVDYRTYNPVEPLKRKYNGYLDNTVESC